MMAGKMMGNNGLKLLKLELPKLQLPKWERLVLASLNLPQLKASRLLFSHRSKKRIKATPQLIDKATPTIGESHVPKASQYFHVKNHHTRHTRHTHHLHQYYQHQAFSKKILNKHNMVTDAGHVNRVLNHVNKHHVTKHHHKHSVAMHHLEKMMERHYHRVKYGHDGRGVDGGNGVSHHHQSAIQQKQGQQHHEKEITRQHLAEMVYHHIDQMNHRPIAEMKYQPIAEMNHRPIAQMNYRQIAQLIRAEMGLAVKEFQKEIKRAVTDTHQPHRHIQHNIGAESNFLSNSINKAQTAPR